MSRQRRAATHRARPADSLDARRAHDESQLGPAKAVAATAALDLLRLTAASHGTNPPSREALTKAARACMSAAGTYWQALVRAAE